MFKIKTPLKTTNNKTAVILDKVIQHTGSESKVYYIGYVINDERFIYACKWTKDGESINIVGNDLVKPIDQFGIGSWRTITDSFVATVTTMSPHVSSRYRLIGFVQDAEGRMYPERWTFEGEAASNKWYCLDANADHDPGKMPF